MQIERLSLSNFRNYESAAIHFDGPRTLIVGPNGVGKSTIIDAIAWVLTGQCRGVDGRGGGQKGLIRDGADRATVTLEMDGKQYQRTVDDAGAQANVKPEAILERLGVSPAMMRAVLDVQAFFNLDHKAAKELLLDLLNVVVRPEDLPTLGLKAPLALADLDFRYKQAFDDRAAAKKALAMLPIPTAPKVADLADGPVSDYEDIRADRADAKTAATMARDAWQNAKSRAESIAQEVAAARGSLAQVTTWESAIVTHRDMLNELDAARLAIILPAKPANLRSMSDIQRELSDLQAMASRVQGHKPAGGCVLNQDIPCNTPAKAFVDHVAGIEKTAKGLKADLKAAEQVTKDQATYDAQFRENGRQVDYHTGQVAKLGAAVDQAKKGEGRIASLEKEAKALIRDLPKLEDAANQTMKADADAERRLLAATTYQEAMKGFHQATARRAKAEDNLGDQNELVDLLGPKGIRATVLDRSVGEFTTAINEAMDGFGFRLQFQIEPWSIVVNGRAYDLLSAGEKLLVGASFQQALALVSGLDFAAIDASEVVVGERRADLTDLVLRSPVRQVIVAMAKPSDEPAPDVDGLQVIEPHKL